MKTNAAVSPFERIILPAIFSLCVFCFSPSLLLEAAETRSIPFYNGRILPTPKQVKYSDSFIPVWKAGKAERTAAICTAPELKNDAAVRDLLDRLAALGAKADVIGDPGDAMRYTTVFFLEKQPAVEKMLAGHGISVPAQQEGYLIYPVKDQNGRFTVFCLGNDREGDYRAVQSLKQLFLREGDTVKMQAAEVFDYPAFRWRGIVGVKPSIPCLFLYKFNCGLIWGPRNWRNPSAKEMADLSNDIVRFREKHFIPIAAVNPTKGTPIVISDPDETEKLVRYFRTSLEAGGGIALLLDDTGLPLPEADRKYFGNGGSAHMQLISRLYQLRKTYPGFPFFVCPPFYWGGGTGYNNAYKENSREYYRIISGMPKDIELFWTGLDVTSRVCSAESASKWASIIGRKPVFWDNWYQYGYPLTPRDFSGCTAFNNVIDGYFLAHNARERDCLGMAMLADYLWNPEAYNPQASLKNALEQLVGPDIYPIYDRWLKKKALWNEIRTALRLPETLHDLHAVSLGKEQLLTKGIHGNLFMFYRRCSGKDGTSWMPDVWTIEPDKEKKDAPASGYRNSGRAFTLTDISGDGTVELLIANTSGGIDVYACSTSSGAPVWKKKETLSGEFRKELVFSFCAADFDGDGQKEILMSFASEDRITAYRKDSGSNRWIADGKLASGLKMSGNTRLFLCAGDVNGDGRTDIVVGAGEGETRVFLNRGKERTEFWEDAGRQGIEPVSELASPALCDADGDGVAELFIANWCGNITGYRKQSGKSPRWIQDETLVPPEARKPEPPVKTLIAELESLSREIACRAWNNLVPGEIENVVRRESRWLNENIFLKSWKKK